MEQNINQVIQRLDLIINLLLRSQFVKQIGVMGIRDQIKWLSVQQLRPVQIAEILGKTQSFVNKELSIIRKNETKKNKDKKGKNDQS